MIENKYAINETIFEGTRTLIYKATLKATNKKVIIKTCCEDTENHGEVYRLKHAYEILNDKSILGAPKIIEYIYNDSNAYLVFEDTGGIVLDEYLKNNTVDEKVFLQIARNAAKALASIHENGIIHRDVKPSNMLINPETLDIHFIDFGISSYVDEVLLVTADNLHGTVEYVSPEQTGRIDASVDARSDLYSLGVTYYQIITDQLPFSGENAMELLHAHIALTPNEPVDIVDINVTTSDIIMKLLKKSPDERYQSAQSLADDWSKCYNALSKGIKVTPFVLGEGDILDSFNLSNKFYGRDAELTVLKKALEKANAGHNELIIIKGESGAGKTQLVNHFEKHLKENGVFLLRGEFEENGGHQPYYPIVSAFEEYYKYMSKSGRDLKPLLKTLKNTFGRNSQVLINMFPFMEEFMGRQEALLPLNYSENQERTERVFNSLLNIFAGPASPVVIFLDNVQWADYESLHLFLSALSDKNLKHMLVIWSLRNDSFENSDVNSILDKINKSPVSLTTVDINFFDRNDVRIVISDMFHSAIDKTNELADYICEVTGGNPLEISYFLRFLYDHKLLRFDILNDEWIWDINSIKSADLKLDMDDEIVSSIRSYSSELQTLLFFMANCGMSFTLEYLQICSAKKLSTKGFFKNIRKFVLDNLISYNSSTDVFSFINSRINKLCLSFMDQETKESMNYRIGQNLLEHFHTSKKELFNHCATIAGHLNIGKKYLETDEEKMQFVEVNLMAGNKAFNGAATSQAIRYYTSAIEFLGDKPFERNYKFAFELFLNLAQCYFSSGNLEKSSHTYDLMLESITDDADRFTVFDRRIEQFFGAFDHATTITLGEQYLKHSGLILDESTDTTEIIAKEREEFLANLENDDFDIFLSIGYAKDITMLQNGSIMSFFAASMYLSNHRLGEYYIHKIYNLAHEHGIFYHFKKALEVIAVILADAGQPERANKLTDLCLKYADKYNMPKSNIYLFHGASISHWLNPLDETVNAYETCKRYSSAEGNLYTGSLCDYVLFDVYAYTGVNIIKFSREVKTAIAFAEKAGYPLAIALFSSVYNQYTRNLLGRTHSTDSFDDKYFNEQAFEKEFKENEFVLAYFYSYKLYALCIHGHYEEALCAFERLNKIIGALGACIPVVQNNFYHSVALARLSHTYPERRDEYISIIKKNQAIMRKWAQQCPENFMHKYMIIQCELAMLDDSNTQKPLNLYADAKKLVEGSKFVLDTIILEECMLLYWERIGVGLYSDYHRKEVCRMCTELDIRIRLYSYDTPDNNDNMPSKSSASVHASSLYLSNKSLDAETILSIMTTLSDDMSISGVSERFLNFMVQNSGSNKGFFVIKNEEMTALEAVFDSESLIKDDYSIKLGESLDNADPKYIPTNILKNVLKKETTIVSHSSKDNYLFYIDDLYIRTNVPESFVCMSIIAREKLVGAVYLENTKLPGVFTEDRINVLMAICSQSAILIENAVYYNEISTYAKTVEIRLKEHISQLNALIAGVAHEINSPVGVCVTVITRMQELATEIDKKFKDAKLSKSALGEFLDETIKGLSISIGNITRAANLIQNFKKVSVDQSTEVFEELNLKDTLKMIAEYIRPAVKKQVDSIEIIAPDDLRIYSCSGTLTQIFTNLIMNAKLHAFDGMEKEGCKITIKVANLGDHAQIVFTDNGRGMSEEQLGKLFQPFYTTKRNAGGSGLGAYIILTLVTQTLNGTVRCVSSLGKGTSYIINLPFDIVRFNK